MKVLALDLGDSWIGVAISDYLGMIARPYKTVPLASLEPDLKQIIKDEGIKTIVVGHPKTMRGTESEQTKKVASQREELQKKFPDITWVTWDERLSSKRALTTIKPPHKGGGDKKRVHAVAAAFILSSYLDYIHIHSKNNNSE